MKKYFLTIIGLIVLLGVGFYALNSYMYSEKQNDTEGQKFSTYVSEVYGFSFQYRAGGDGYVREEVVPSLQEDQDLQHIVVLMLKSDYNTLQEEARDITREGPPTLNIAIYNNPQNTPVDEWVDAHPNAVNRDLVLGTITEDIVAGEQALRMKTDGLYVTNVALVSHRGYIYLFTGGFIDENSPQVRDFEYLLSSVTWE